MLTFFAAAYKKTDLDPHVHPRFSQEHIIITGGLKKAGRFEEKIMELEVTLEMKKKTKQRVVERKT